MNLGIETLSKLTVFSKYARYIPELHRRETWDEIVTRYQTMLTKKYPLLKDSIERNTSFIKEKKILPSMRLLQFSGLAAEVNNARTYNCAYCPIDSIYSFAEIMFLLLGGTGVGYSVQKHHVAMLPPVYKSNKKKRNWLIEDSLLGWSDAIKVLMKCYLNGGFKPVFDYRAIRPKGARLVTAGGKAPGAEPLRICIAHIEAILERKNDGEKLTPLECHDIICHIANSVLAGGIRRCLPEGAMVHTDKGLIEIENIQVGDNVLTFDGYRKVKNVFNQGEQDTIKILTQTGYFECTPNHRVAVLTDMAKYEWKEAGRLQKDDRMIFSIESIDGNSHLPDFTYENPKHSTTCKDITIPELTTEIAYLFGQVAGDGYIHISNEKKKSGVINRRGRVTIACSDNYPEIVEKVTNAFSKFGIKSITKKGDGKLKNVTAYSYQLALYMSQWKLPKQEIIVPEFILQGDRYIKGAYIAGLFDSDGCATNRPVRLLNSVYPKFARQVQNLYSSLGIITKFSRMERKEKNWKALTQLSLVGKSAYDGFLTYVQPFAIKKVRIDNNHGQHTYTLPSKLLPVGIKGPDDRSMETVNKYLNIPTTYLPVKVTGIDRGRSVNTFDIEVDDRNEFICEGYLVHNSACLSLFSIDDEEMLTCKYGKWYETNEQRGRCNNSVVLERGKITEEQFFAIWKRIEASGSGEPGIYWTNNREVGCNPCCFTGDTKILTDNGYKPIRECIGDNIFINKNGEKVNGIVWSNGLKNNIIELTLSNSSRIRCTDDHPFMLNSGEKALAIDTLSKRLMPHYEINREVSEFTKYGYLQGDGALGRLISDAHRGLEIYIGCKDDDIFEMFDIVKEEDNTNYYTRGFNEILKSLQFDSSPLPERLFPKTYAFWNMDDKSMFLKGMYSANGCVIKNQRIAYKTTSSKLANELLHALLEFGIKGYITINKEKEVQFSNGNYTCKQSYDVNISCYSAVIEFARRIGFVHNYKNRDLEELILNKSPKVIRITPLSEFEEVFDFSLEDDTHWGVVEGVIAHNCEISLRPYSFCNLCEVNVDNVEDQYDLEERVCAAAFFGTLQAGITNFHYLRPIWKTTTDEDALLGISLTGIASGRVMSLDLSSAASEARIINADIADIIGINRASRLCCIKPAGTTSSVLGTSSGIHAWHSKYYLRTMRFNKNEDIALYLMCNHPELCEDDVLRPNDTICVRVPVKAPEGAILRDETVDDLLERIKKFYREWILIGHVKGDNTHNISATISIKDDEWEKVGRWLWDNKEYYNGISVLPYFNHSYKQAPFEEITEEEYNNRISTLTDINLTKVIELDDIVDFSQIVACGGGACEIH